MLFGVDFSHWNTEKPYIGDFQIHKITEGAKYVDESFYEWYKKCETFISGIYHFISAKDSADSQAENLIKTMKKYDVKDCIVALDWESEAQTKFQDGTIVKDIINSLWNKGLNFQPVIYLNKTACTQISTGKYCEWFKNNCCFWVADYSTTSFKVENYSGIKPLIRQFCSKPICDMNVFYGNHVSLEKICKATYFTK